MDSVCAVINARRTAEVAQHRTQQGLHAQENSEQPPLLRAAEHSPKRVEEEPCVPEGRFLFFYVK